MAIVTRDRAEPLRRNLGAALADLKRDGAAVLVVDQSQGGATRAVVEELGGVRYIRSGPGLSRGRNAAVAASDDPIVAFTDDDVVLPPGWVGSILAAFEQTPAAGAVCGRAETPAGDLLAGRDAGLYAWPTNPFRLGSGFNFAFRRTALADAGPFDESLGAGARFRSAEDTDMLYRVMRAGWQVLCRDDIAIVHDERRTLSEQLRIHHGYGMGAGAQTLKHALDGDRVALGIAFRELAHHAWYLVRSVLLLRVRVAAFQVCFISGFARAAVTAWPELRARRRPSARKGPPEAR